MLSDVQLQENAVKMHVPLEGIHFKNCMPQKLKYNVSYILNMEDELTEEGKPNDGSHWVALQINKDRDGRISPIYFDSFGCEPPVAVRAAVKNFCGKFLPHCSKDVQSLVSDTCGCWVMAFLHWTNASQFRSGELYSDVACFLDMFSDLNVETDFHKNEYVLKHFFRSDDESLRVAIEI